MIMKRLQLACPESPLKAPDLGQLSTSPRLAKGENIYSVTAVARHKKKVLQLL